MIDLIEALGDSTADFHAAILLTYRLDLELYDGLVRRVLNRAGVTSQVVFCDFNTYVEEITTQRPRFLGRQYSVVPVHQQGAFHPKVYLLLGPRRGRLLVGSGNVSVGGLVRNAEVFGQFDYSSESGLGPHLAFSELTGFVRQLAERAPDPARRQIDQALRVAGWLELPHESDGRRILIGGAGREALLEQIRKAIPVQPGDELLVCSSSFDRRLKGLRRLAETVRRPPTCIVQPDRVDLDGAEVRRLGKSVDWRKFEDPYPKEKRRRRDVYAHAKLFVFRHGNAERAVFGSCNASEPALMGPNTEVVVVLPPCQKGLTVERLGLQKSLKASAREEVAGKAWREAEPEGVALPSVLLGVSVLESRFVVTAGQGTVPPKARLAVAGASHEAPVTILGLTSRPTLTSDRFALTENLRVAWLVSTQGVAISNPVAITWPEVAEGRRRGTLGRKFTQGILGLHDGVLVGTILFELLDAFRDFEVIRVAGVRPPRDATKPDADEPAEQRPAKFFYTDAGPADQVQQQWTGDRLDLDLLASLVQPLSPDRSDAGDRNGEDDDDFDESALAEEAERRQIDAQKGKATGAERKDMGGITKERLEKSIRRFERRLDRAAASIEGSLKYLDRLESIPPQSIARQIWMVQIGAFLSERLVTTDDGEQLVCLAPLSFADYVMRVSRALVGSKRGGFLDKLPAGLWESADGHMLRRGLGFLRVCAVWATAVLEDEFTDVEPDEWPESLACAVPELVTVRLWAKLDALGVAADLDDMQRRFPALENVDSSRLTRLDARIKRLASAISEAERDASGVGEAGSANPAHGALVYNDRLGVTVVMDKDERYYHLADLSREGEEPAMYAKAHVRPVVIQDPPCWMRCFYDSAATLNERRGDRGR